MEQMGDGSKQAGMAQLQSKQGLTEHLSGIIVPEHAGNLTPSTDG